MFKLKSLILIFDISYYKLLRGSNDYNVEYIYVFGVINICGYNEIFYYQYLYSASTNEFRILVIFSHLVEAVFVVYWSRKVTEIIVFFNTLFKII